MSDLLNKAIGTLERLCLMVSRHNQYIAELGGLVNRHTDRLDDLAAILDASVPPEHEPSLPPLRKPVVIRLIEHGDNVVSCPKFRSG